MTVAMPLVSRFDTTTCALLLFISLILYHLVFSVYQASKLSHVPGPWYTLISNHVLQWHEFHHNRTQWIHALHQKYGPVVRLSSTEVHFNSLSAVRTIYGVRSPVVKDEYYGVFAHNGVRNMFSTISDAEHAEKKRGIANVYSRSAIMRADSLQRLNDRVEEFVKLLDNEDGVELYLVLSYLTLDVVSSFVFGEAARAHVLCGDKKNQTRVAEDMDSSRDWSRFFKRGGHWILAQLVELSYPLLSFLDRMLEVYSAGEEATSCDGLNAYISEACLQSLDQADITEEKASSVVAKLNERKQNPKYILSEVRDHVLAGSDTTTTVLTYLFHALAIHPEVCIPLREAILRLSKDEHGQIEPAELDTCECLDRVVTESLRLYAAIPMTLPRIMATSTVVDGVLTPAGTQVGVQCYSLHRDASIFTDPEAFEPQRWKEPSKAMRDQMWAFSSGSRSCIGKPLAMMEMKLAVARVVQEYEFTILELRKDGLRMREDTTRLTMAPEDRKIRMKFTKIERLE